jgi:hypothetical protein
MNESPSQRFKLSWRRFSRGESWKYVTRNYSKEKGAPASGESFKDVVNGRGKGISRRLPFSLLDPVCSFSDFRGLGMKKLWRPLFVWPETMGLQMFYSKTATPELYNQAAVAAAGGGMIRSHRPGGGHTNHQIREVATPVLPRPVPVCVISSWWLEKYDDLSSWAAPDQCVAAWSIVALQVLHSWSAWALINHVWPFCDLLCLLQTVELCVPICCMKCEKKVREAVLDMDGMVRHQARRISS